MSGASDKPCHVRVVRTKVLIATVVKQDSQHRQSNTELQISSMFELEPAKRGNILKL